MPDLTPEKKKRIERIPPHNKDAEIAVLGSLLIDRNAIYKVSDTLAAADFYIPANERIYEAILSLYEKGAPFDVFAVTTHLKEKGQLEGVGGAGYLSDLTNAITTSSHVAHYAKKVKDKKILRDLINTSAAITEQAFSPADELEVMLDGVESAIFSISQKSVTKNFVAVKDELKLAFERLEKLSENKGSLRGIPTGFKKIDGMLSGLQKSDLVILGARPSLGKTTFALDICRKAASKGHSVGIYSLEMSREQVIDRLVAAESEIPLWQLRTGNLRNETDFQMFQMGLDKLSTFKIFIDDTPSPNILQMKAMARRLQMEHGLDLLVVDYLQLIAPRRSSDNMVAQVTEISRSLKALARELEVPVLALSQLSRNVDQRDNKEPQLHDLRESGSIEQDADVVMFIHRDRIMVEDMQTMDPAEIGRTKIKIAKHRNGPTGIVEIKFDPDKVTFRDLEERYGDGESGGSSGTDSAFSF